MSGLGWTVLAMALGGGVGFAEILSRYRDEPFAAARSPYGASYIALNAVIAGLAYGLLAWYPDAIFPGLKDDSLMRSIIAGFGAMVVMRSKLFTFKNGEEEHAIGPEAALEVLLRTVDRGIDRWRSGRRLALALEFATEVKDEKKGVAFLRTAIGSYQNLSGDDKKEVDVIIKQIEADTAAPELKLMAAGFMMITVGGEANFREVIKGARAHSGVTAKPSEKNPLDGPPGGGQGDHI